MSIMHYARKVWHWFFPNDSYADKILDKLRFGKYKKC
ncbi:hypothetical protein LCGC14_0862700 [marine sediment metagenome]|uniref:Uncharacterized protein n=1 Tax=marine sediment metagenome TaxID=412755 RepID=A0A0F9SE13_9ZZZZ